MILSDCKFRGDDGELSPKLRETAEIRLENPEATLGELAEMSGISKSGLSHRFSKIRQLAEKRKVGRNMKFGKKHFLKCAVAALTVLAGFTVYGADVRTPAVADKIVRLPIEQIAVRAPKVRDICCFLTAPSTRLVTACCIVTWYEGIVVCIFTMSIKPMKIKKILVVASNSEDKPVDIYVRGSWYSHPSEDYYGVGRELSEIYYKDKQKEYKITVQPRSTALLDERLNDVVVYPTNYFQGLSIFE